MMFMYRFLGQISFVIFMVCWLPNVFAADVLPKSKLISLKEAIFLSLRFNPNIQAAELTRIIDKFNLATAQNAFEFQYALGGVAGTSQSVTAGEFGGINRNFGVNAAITQKTTFGTVYGVTMNNPWTVNTLSPPYQYAPSLTLSVAQPLLQGSGQEVVGAPLQQAYIVNEQAKLALKSTIISQVNLIISDYISVVGNENSLIIAKQALKDAEKTVEQNNVNIKIGFMAPADNDQAKAAVANAALNVSVANNALIQTRLILLKDMGLDPHTPFKVDTKISIKGWIYPKGEEAKRLLFANSIIYLSALYGLKSSKLGLLLAEDSQRWALNLIGTVTQGNGSGIGDNGGIASLFNGLNKSRALGLALTIPIDNLAVQSSVVGAKVGYTQAKLLFKQLKLSLETQLMSDLESLRIQYDQIGLAENAQVLANKSYQNSLVKLKFGQVSVFEVTTLQANLVTAQLNTINNQLQYINSIATFQQTLGITLDFWKIRLVY